ncbi:DUF1993 domain-containing protein [Tsuneonella suprasediminis]|uniref:DUF1993 domain-containing protein n=1 Tax=Tsuneonella suprasediminis TaxID=2306996 RepID=A0A419R692_9SPHN|nr:DUF1993 domain-containing protein [Tsuneonella suprasediminis]RJX71314.1 DUF1993 domain-containing protein [Tsuneonella suprasediminis]
MPLSLHAAYVPSALQMLGATRHIVDKAEEWCAESGTAPADLVGACLREDMLPFAYQVKSVATHTALALEGVRAGQFSPDMSPPPIEFDAMRAKLDTATETLEAAGEEEFESFIGKPMVFTIKDKFRLDFTADNFLLSFSQPNFYFHASTAYGILRMKGAQIGKQDYLGRMRLAG